MPYVHAKKINIYYNIYIFTIGFQKSHCQNTNSTQEEYIRQGGGMANQILFLELYIFVDINRGIINLFLNRLYISAAVGHRRVLDFSRFLGWQALLRTGLSIAIRIICLI